MWHQVVLNCQFKQEASAALGRAGLHWINPRRAGYQNLYCSDSCSSCGGDSTLLIWPKLPAVTLKLGLP